jgi:C4-type Zn-finger protein
MSKLNQVSVVELSEKIIRSYGFFCLINEGKKVSVIVEDDRSLSMIRDYLMAHPELLEKILQDIQSYNASLN